jgi:hypothetical protein
MGGVDPEGLQLALAAPPQSWAAVVACASNPYCAGTVAVVTIVGGCIWLLSPDEPDPNQPVPIKPPSNAYDPNGPKAPGKPGADDGFEDPKGGDDWARNPNGNGNGWRDKKGNVWVPSGQGGKAHGGPHWDVQTPGGGYRNVRPRK